MAGASPLFELLVRIRSDGLKELDEQFKEYEERFEKYEEKWDEYAKQYPKQLKEQKKSLSEFAETFGKMSKDFDGYRKSWDEYSKKFPKDVKEQDKALNGLLSTLGKVKSTIADINKTGLKLTGDTRGIDSLQSELGDLQKQVDELKDTKIVIRTSIEGADDVISKLREISDLKTELTKDGGEVVITARVDNGAETVQTLDDINARKQAIGQEPLVIEVQDQGLRDLNQEVEQTGQSVDRGRESVKQFNVDLDHTSRTSKDTSRGVRDVGSSVRQMDADARTATALPTLLGDAFTQITKLQTVMAAVAAATIPTMIAGAAALGSEVAVLTAGVGALATGLGVGLATAATAAAGAFGLAEGAVVATGVAAQSALSEIFGLDKGLFTLGGTVKEAQGEVKAFNKLVAEMPAGTEAAAQAQERLTIAQQKQAAATQLQIDWWGKYGAAANSLARTLSNLHIELTRIISDTGGQLIPVIQDFANVAEKHIPAVEKAFAQLAQGVDRGTAGLRNFLTTSQGLADVDNLIQAIGRSAEPAFRILSDGGIVALQAIQPIIPTSEELLARIADLTDAASEWAQSAEGQKQINEAWQLGVGYATELGQAVYNLVAAGGSLSQVFIQSGLVDFMLDGFVSMTQSIRDAASAATEADSRFRVWLEAAKPILSATADAAREIVTQVLRVVEAVTEARDASTGLLIMEEILTGIRDAAEPLADALIGTFEDLGPILAQLIPELAQFFQLFLTSTPELTIFLGLFTDLLTIFNDLPDPVQQVAARILGLSLLFGSMTGDVTSLVHSFLSWQATLFGLSKLLGETVTTMDILAFAFGGLATKVSAAATSAWEAITALSALEVALVALAAVAAITLVVTFDEQAAEEAYQQAEDAGQRSGEAYATALVAGTKNVPVLGELLAWVDENLSKPVDNWIQENFPNLAYQLGIGWKDGLDEAAPEVEASGEELGSSTSESVSTGLESTDPIGDWLSDATAKLDAWAAEDPIGTWLGEMTTKIDEWGASDPIGQAIGVQADTLPEALGAITGLIVGYTIKWGAAFDEWGNSDPIGNALADITASINDWGNSDPFGPPLTNIATSIDDWGSSDPFGQALGYIVQRFDEWGSSDPLGNALSEIATAIDDWGNEDPFGDALSSIQQAIDDWGNSDPIGDALSDITTSIEDWVNGPLADALSSMVDGFLEKFNEVKDKVVQNSIVPEMVDGVSGELDRMNSESDTAMSTWTDTIVGAAQDIYDQIVGGSIIPDLVSRVGDLWDELKDSSAVKWGTDIYNTIVDAAQKIYDKIVGSSIFPELVNDSLKEWERLDSQSESPWSSLFSTVTGWASKMASDALRTIGDMVTQALHYFELLEAGAKRVLSFIGVTSAPTPSSGAPPPSNRAKGGIDDNAEMQAPTGGVSTGIAPRVVYGEQRRNVKEAYIVEDRPDNVPYLAEAASWHGYGLFPIEEMARGGVRRGRGRRHRGGGRRGGRGHRRGARMGGGRDGRRHRSRHHRGRHHRGGRRGARRGGRRGGGRGGHHRGGAFARGRRGGHHRGRHHGHHRGRHHRGHGRKRRHGRHSGGGGGGGGGGGTTGRPTGGGTGTGGTGTPSTGGGGGGRSGDVNQNISVTNSTSGGGGGAGAGASPSEQAFPSSCGTLYPVAQPTPGDQQPYVQIALTDEEMMVITSGVGGTDHVNLPAGTQHPGDAAGCGVSGSGSPPPTPWTSSPQTTGATSQTAPYQQCGPSFAMATGGIHVSNTGEGAQQVVNTSQVVGRGPSGRSGAGRRGTPATGAANPMAAAAADGSIYYREVNPGWWDGFLDEQWYGDPAADWDYLYEPAGWDPGTMYAPATTTAYAKGGIERNGIRYFQGGGLNEYQLQAGYDSGMSVIGSPYLYGWADPSMGFDCSGLMQWIYQAVAEGGSVPGERYIGTWGSNPNWSDSPPAGFAPGPLPGAFNVYTDVEGWEGDGTHTSGDIMDTPFESVFSGVANTSSASGGAGIWAMGDPATVQDWAGATPGSYDPTGDMSGQVASWWDCQSAPVPQLPPSPFFDGVESWMTTLPGMTQDYLTDVGYQNIGTLGGYSQPLGTTVRDWAIAGLEADGYDASEENIAAIEALANCETGGDPNATGPNGELGLMQLMPDTWDQFNVGGDPYDPVANIAASLNYQMARYGQLVETCPYEKGGLALSPHLGLVGEKGSEAMIPLEHKDAMRDLRMGLGTAGLEEGFAALAQRIDNVAARVDYQTKTLPPDIGTSVNEGVKGNLANSRSYHDALSKGADTVAKRKNFAGSL